MDLRVRIRYRDGRRFVRAELKESSESLGNPGCGWYHVYTFAAKPPADGRPVEEETWLDGECRKEQLALALIDIGSYRTGAISQEALTHIEEIFRFFRREGKQMILRFAYDIRGEARVTEPSDIALVRRHMEQLGGIIGGYERDILVIQGILVGNWGEMHGSRFLDEASVCGLARTWYQVTKGRCYLAVRTPAQWRKIVENKEMECGIEERLALFNESSVLPQIWEPMAWRNLTVRMWPADGRLRRSFAGRNSEWTVFLTAGKRFRVLRRSVTVRHRRGWRECTYPI